MRGGTLFEQIKPFINCHGDLEESALERLKPWRKAAIIIKRQLVLLQLEGWMCVGVSRSDFWIGGTYREWQSSWRRFLASLAYIHPEAKFLHYSSAKRTWFAIKGFLWHRLFGGFIILLTRFRVLKERPIDPPLPPHEPGFNCNCAGCLRRSRAARELEAGQAGPFV